MPQPDRSIEPDGNRIPGDSGGDALPESLEALEVRREEVLSFDWIVRELEEFHGKPLAALEEGDRDHVIYLLREETGLEYPQIADRLGLDRSSVYGSQLSYFKRLESESEVQERLEVLQVRLQERAETVIRETTSEAWTLERAEEERQAKETEDLVRRAVEYFFGNDDADPRDRAAVRLRESFLCAMLKENGVPIRRIMTITWKTETTIRSRIKDLDRRSADPVISGMREEIRDLIRNPETIMGSPAGKPDELEEEIQDGDSGQTEPADAPAEDVEPEIVAIEPEEAVPVAIAEEEPLTAEPTPKPPARKNKGKSVREVPLEEAELFEGLKNGDPDQRKEFERRYGHLVQEVVAASGYDGSDEALETAREALDKAARYFVPQEHPDFETWATKVISKDLERLKERLELAEAVAAVEPAKFVRAALKWRKGAKRSLIVTSSRNYRTQVNEAKRSADSFLDEKLRSLEDSESVTDKRRRELEKEFPDEVGEIALASYVLRHVATGKKGGPVPAFEQLTEEQQREVMELVFERTVESS